jgi:hypothetical protein
LRLRADDGQALTHERIQQCGFAGVGAAENGNESGVKGHKD